jgi:hypothetical protein
LNWHVFVRAVQMCSMQMFPPVQSESATHIGVVVFWQTPSRQTALPLQSAFVLQFPGARVSGGSVGARQSRGPPGVCGSAQTVPCGHWLSFVHEFAQPAVVQS